MMIVFILKTVRLSLWGKTMSNPVFELLNSKLDLTRVRLNFENILDIPKQLGEYPELQSAVNTIIENMIYDCIITLYILGEVPDIDSNNTKSFVKEGLTEITHRDSTWVFTFNNQEFEFINTDSED